MTFGSEDEALTVPGSMGYEYWHPCAIVRWPVPRRAHCGPAGVQSESLSLGKQASQPQTAKQRKVLCCRGPFSPLGMLGGGRGPPETARGRVSQGKRAPTPAAPARVHVAVLPEHEPGRFSNCAHAVSGSRLPRKERPGGCLCGPLGPPPPR